MITPCPIYCKEKQPNKTIPLSSLPALQSILLNKLRTKIGSRIITAAFFTFAGVMHFIRAPFFVSIVPPQLSHPLALVYISGSFEILGGIGLLVPQFRRFAGNGLILLLLAVFPANIYMFTKTLQTQGICLPTILLAIRLPLQFVLIALVNWVSKMS
jgi:uncharacterized membrane protein